MNQLSKETDTKVVEIQRLGNEKVAAAEAK
jgi:hypothetical protein